MTEIKINRRRYRCPISDDARLIVIERYEDGAKKLGFYYRNREKVGGRYWNNAGKLNRGFPHFFIGGKKITKRQYLRACKSDESLPLYCEQENIPERKLPAEYLAQRIAE